MDEIFPPSKIKVSKIENKGRGIIAIQKILKDEIIENCPLIILGEKDSEFIKDKNNSDVLYYYYLQQPEVGRNSIMLGYGSLYNHNSSDPNCELDFEEDAKFTHIIFRAIKDIEIGEEITWDYEFDNGDVEFLEMKKTG